MHETRLALRRCPKPRQGGGGGESARLCLRRRGTAAALTPSGGLAVRGALSIWASPDCARRTVYGSRLSGAASLARPRARGPDIGVLGDATPSMAQRGGPLRRVSPYATGGLFQGATLTVFFHRFTIRVLSQNGDPASIRSRLMEKWQKSGPRPLQRLDKFLRPRKRRPMGRRTDVDNVACVLNR